MAKGLLITIEGIDGSGKSTQINFIKNYLEQIGCNVLVTREPGGTEISEKIRSIILDPENKNMGSITELLLYASARAQLVFEVIKPALYAGNIVVCDRFIDSTIAYQGYGRGINIDSIICVNNLALQGVQPDLTILLDISPENALKRRLPPLSFDRIEQEDNEFYRKVSEGYRSLAKKYPERIKSIDADRCREDVFNDIKIYIDKLLWILVCCYK